MDEIRRIPWNGLKVVSTFSGCGGSSTGYKMAGCRVLGASEFIPVAAETYRANHPDTYLDTNDIRTLQADKFMDAMNLQPGTLDILDGSPPCSSYSTAGKTSEGWGKAKLYSGSVKQRTDDLFDEFLRLLAAIQPRAFVVENVAGLVRGVSRGVFSEVISAMRAAGYRVACRVLDAQWLGVPQRRARTIFIGLRTDLGVAPQHPKPFPHRYTLAEALDCEAGDTSDASIDRFAIGREWERLGRPGTQSDKYFSLVRPRLDEPCPTFTAVRHGAAKVVHPTEKRGFTINELKRIAGFPADYVFTGTYDEQQERIGRAVPPLMMKAIALSVAAQLKESNHV
jgi:DNA (cytosine-5)-methyltransferase 1